MEESVRWLDKIGVSVVVCSREGICSFVNERARMLFAELGTVVEVGTNLIDCHPETARDKFLELLADPKVTTYTVDKRGKRLLVRQEPICVRGQCVGILQLGFVVPEPIPHVVRDE